MRKRSFFDFNRFIGENSELLSWIPKPILHLGEIEICVLRCYHGDAYVDSSLYPRCILVRIEFWLTVAALLRLLFLGHSHLLCFISVLDSSYVQLLLENVGMMIEASERLKSLFII
ncbi:hypothetical protein L6452_00743 [Arctium lappa]|uniref:Uncharacterized protein n=1 Tax=Arctium lappa TaxID=4217 RepID=A0ACB9FEB5_ARCLA|nr:hypothetical protein L6452_00743 [Arctium lappa]